MHTIVLRFGQKYDDWHLIEPFFYEAQNNGQMKFFWEEEAQAATPVFLSMTRKILDYLDKHRIQHWQVVFLFDSSDKWFRQYRLATLLAGIHEEFLVKLQKKGFSPHHVIVYLLDTIMRNPDQSPADSILKKHWEIDKYGYLVGDHASEGNAFTKKELDKLDTIWGKEVNLHRAGVLQKPNKEFLEALTQKCNLVGNSFAKLVEMKRLRKKVEGGHDDWFSSTELTEVLEDFRLKLKQMRTPPLRGTLASFKPSVELKALLRHRFGVFSEMNGICLVRQEVYVDSHRHRLKGLLELSYFLLAIVSHENIINRLEKGSSNKVTNMLNEERLEQLILRYHYTLKLANEEMNHHLLVHQHYHTSRLQHDDLTRNIMKVVERTDDDLFKPLTKKMSHTYFDRWENQLTLIEHSLEKRQNALVQASKDAIQKLTVLKRKKDFIQEEESVEINDYLRELEKEMGVVQHKVIVSAPSLLVGVDAWKEKTAEFKKRMLFYLQSVPNLRQYVMATLLMMFALLFPHYLTLDASVAATNWERFYVYLSLPVVGVLFALCAIFFTRKRAFQPVDLLHAETVDFTKETEQLQKDAQQKYNDYINNLIHLFMVKKHYEKTIELANQKKETNMLNRYHQVKLEEYIQNSSRLLHILQFYKQNFEAEHNRVPQVSLKTDTIHNPVYSPFFHQKADKNNGQGHGFDVMVGSAKEHYESLYLTQLEQIRLQEDKVYNYES